MLTNVVIPNLVKEICRAARLVVSSQFFTEMKSEKDGLLVTFYLANTKDEEVVVVRFKGYSNGVTGIDFKYARSVTIKTATTPWFNQEVQIAITDDREENYSVVASMVAKILKSK